MLVRQNPFAFLRKKSEGNTALPLLNEFIGNLYWSTLVLFSPKEERGSAIDEESKRSYESRPNYYIFLFQPVNRCRVILPYSLRYHRVTRGIA